MVYVCIPKSSIWRCGSSWSLGNFAVFLGKAPLSDSQYLFPSSSLFFNGQKLSEKTDKVQGKLVAGLVNHLGEVAMLLIGGLSIICQKMYKLKKKKEYSSNGITEVMGSNLIGTWIFFTP